MPLIDLFERQPPRLLHEVDQPEISGSEYDHLAVRDVLFRGLAPFGSAACCLSDRQSDHLTLLVAAGVTAHVGRLDRPLDELVEAVPVALLERCALRLAVVGKHDELIGARCVAPCALETTE